VAVSGYSFKIQIRPRFERFERLKKNIQFHFLNHRCALDRPQAMNPESYSKNYKTVCKSTFLFRKYNRLRGCLRGCKCTMGLSRPRPPLRSTIALHVTRYLTGRCTMNRIREK
jgi:hypothetical protein